MQMASKLRTFLGAPLTAATTVKLYAAVGGEPVASVSLPVGDTVGADLLDLWRAEHGADGGLWRVRAYQAGRTVAGEWLSWAPKAPLGAAADFDPLALIEYVARLAPLLPAAIDRLGDTVETLAARAERGRRKEAERWRDQVDSGEMGRVVSLRTGG